MSNLANVKRKPIMVSLGGKELEFKYTLESFSEMEEVYGSVEAGMQALEQNKIKDMKFFIYQGFTHLDNHPTESQVAKGIDFRDIGSLSQVIMRALSADAPETSDQTGTNPN